jgi:hypothetical protein
MMSTLSTDDCLGITLALAIITILLVPQRCLSWSSTLLACYYGLIALLARTEVSVFLIFLFLLVEDLCHAIIRAIKPFVLARLGIFGRSNAQTAPNSATYAAISLPAPVNTQLLDWMQEDAEDFWKLKGNKREEEAQKSQELRETYRELASSMPEREVSDWSLFEMEARETIDL